MQRVTALLLLLLFCSAAASQNAVEGINITQRPGDSATVIKQWLFDAVSLSGKDSSKAEEFFFKAIHAAERNRDRALLADAKMKFAEFLFSRQLIHRSFGNFIEAKEIYLKLDAPRELALATIGVARTQYFRGNYRNALRNFLEAVTLAKQLNMNEVESEASEYLGLLYNVSQNFSAGISFFRQSFELKNRIGDEKGVIRMANKLSEVYYERRKFDSSFYFSNVALEGAESMNLRTDIYHARLAKTAALIRMQKWNEAGKELMELAGSAASHKRDVNFFVRYHVVTGNYYLSQRQTERGMASYDSALSSPNKNRFPELFAHVYKNMAESYHEIGDYKTAYGYYQQYTSALQGLLSGEHPQNLGNMEVLVEADKSKDEIRLLSVENKLKQLQLLREAELRQGLEKENMLMDSIILQEKNLSEALSRENILKSGQLENEKKLRTTEASRLSEEKKLRLSLLIGLGTALLMGAVIFYQYRRQRNKNTIIERQSAELQELMKEIHHRVKNNLQVVSSLLNLQSHYIKDSEAVDAVKDSRNRVLSMALIHQSLYQEGDLQSIHVPDYIDKLCDSLFSSYNISPDKIKLVKHIQPLSINVDTLIPAGLILNELITNSLKYAFPSGKTGTVTITVKEVPDALLLQVEDDGVGLPAAFASDEKSSFGFKMIHSFLQKLKGQLQISSDNGTKATVFIKNYK
ncbi:MAG: histidine kinase dimerization/phosphoacceptor domain -containing protein [Bacteroidota bacterium]